MIILEPIAHETLWGGHFLAKYFKGEHGRIGHMYSLFDDMGNSNTILNGPYMGKPFHDYFMERRTSMGLDGYDRFPLVLAIVEAADHLSLQVHPDDETARELEGAEFGKNESWYFLRCPESGWIYNGMRCESIEEAKVLIKEHRAIEIPDRLKVREQDYIYVQAGTLHALTAGSLVYEIEENAEYTYRFYDFDRKDAQGKERPLHLEQAMRALKPGLQSSSKRYEGTEITERLYGTKLLPSLQEYVNQSATWECVTVLDEQKTTMCDDVTVGFGMTVVLEPGDRLSLAGSPFLMARPIT